MPACTETFWSAAEPQCSSAVGADDSGTAITGAQATFCSPKQPAAKSPAAPGLGAVDHAVADATSTGAAEGPEEAESSDDEDEYLSDGDLSSWGSMDEMWDADSDYYDTEEEDEALEGTVATSCCTRPTSGCRLSLFHARVCAM